MTRQKLCFAAVCIWSKFTAQLVTLLGRAGYSGRLLPKWPLYIDVDRQNYTMPTVHCVSKTSKRTWKLKDANSILETFEYFCQITSKSIVTISSYTVSKLGRFLRHSVLLSHRRRSIFNTKQHRHSDAQPWASECPDVKNYKWRLNPVWARRMLYSCTHMATVSVKGLNMSIENVYKYTVHVVLYFTIVELSAVKSVVSRTIFHDLESPFKVVWATESLY